MRVKLLLEPGAPYVIEEWQGRKEFKKYLEKLGYEGTVLVERTDAEKHPYRLTIIGELKYSNGYMVIVIDLEEPIYEISRTLL